MEFEETDLNVVCVSNGNADIFDNTLTSFKNKLPTAIQWRKNGLYRYHVALTAIGFDTNFTTTILPDKPGIPSLITSKQFKSKTRFLPYQKKPPHSQCVALNSIPDACNTTNLDKLAIHAVNEYSTFNYHFLEDELFNIKRFIEFFKNVVQFSDSTLKMTISSDNLTITLKSISEIRENPNKPDGYYTPVFMLFHHTLIESIDVQPIWTDDLLTYDHLMYKYAEDMFNELIIFDGEVYYKYYLHTGFQWLQLSLRKVNTKKVPNIVKLKFNGIRSQIFDTINSRDLICFHPNISVENDKKRYFFHEIDKKTFFPLENTTLDTLEFNLVDQYDKHIKLNTGVATLVRLQFRKMPYFKKSFSVTMTSRPNETYPNNTNSNFTLELPETLYLNKNWRVSVNAVNLPNYFNTLPSNNYIIIRYDKHDTINSKVVSSRPTVVIPMPEKVFTKNELLEYINSRISSQCKESIITFEENIESGEYHPTVLIKINKPNALIGITKNLALLLGYGADDFFQFKTNFFKQWSSENTLPSSGHHEIRMTYPINMDYFVPSYIMLYSNIVSPTIIGGNYSNILKIFPIVTTNDDYVIHQFKNPEYHELLNDDVKTINLQFRTHAGDFINFSSSEIVIVDLNFSNFE